MGLHESFLIDGIDVDFKEELNEKDYVKIVRYLFSGADHKPRSSFFYRKLTEPSYMELFHEFREDLEMRDFLYRLYLLSKADFEDVVKKELNFFFDYGKKDF